MMEAAAVTPTSISKRDLVPTKYIPTLECPLNTYYSKLFTSIGSQSRIY